MLSRRTLKLLELALFRWESATLISATTLLTALAWFFRYLPEVPDRGWLGALAFGLVSEGLLVVSSLIDPASRARVAQEEGGDPALPVPPTLQTVALQRQIDKALDYYRRILEAAEKRGSSPLRRQFDDTLGQIRDWLRTIFQLAERLDHYHRQQDGLIQDRRQAEQRLRELSRQLRDEESAQVRTQLEENMAALGDQLRSLQTLEETMEQARLRLEHTLSALSTIRSQSLLIDFKDADGGRVSELRNEVKEEKAVLDAILGAMARIDQTGNG